MIRQKISIKSFFYYLVGMSLFLLPLIHAWMIYPLSIENIQTSYSALGGILPWCDAAAYYHGANDFLRNGVLNEWNTRRPLNAILFAMRLWVTNNNFQAALMIQALLCGFSCLLVARSVGRNFGKVASLTTLFILFLFSAVFTPTTLSEALGLTIGCLGFVLLWEAVQSQIRWLFFAAFLMLVVGLNVRSGAFFVLPLFVLWLGYNFRGYKPNCKFNWPISIASTCGLISGFLFNIILIKLYRSPTEMGVMHGNFACVLFGLVSGGKSWIYAYELYPNISGVTNEAEISKFLYLKSWEVFKSNPFLLLLGILRSWGGTCKGLFSFFQSQLSVQFSSYIPVILIRLLGFGVVCLSLYRIKTLYKTYRNEIGLITAALLGMFLSAAIIWTDGGFRVFAVTVPFFAAAFGIAAGSYFSRLTSPQNDQEPTVSLHWETYAALILSGFLLVMGILGPKLIHLTQASPSMRFQFSCAPGETAMVVKKISGAPHLRLLKAEAFRKNIVDGIVEDVHKQYFSRILEPDILTKPMVLGCVYDVNAGHTKFILGPQNLFSVPNTWVGLCASKISGAGDIMQVKSYEVLSEK